MPGKTPQPWYRKGRGWFVWLNGKQFALGKDKAEAFRRFHLLMAGEVPTAKKELEQAPELETSLGVTVKELLDLYIADAKRRMASSTHFGSSGTSPTALPRNGAISVLMLCESPMLRRGSPSIPPGPKWPNGMPKLAWW
jgi:hypothetical protein